MKSIEIVLRGNNGAMHDLFAELQVDGTVKVLISAKNGTGQSSFTIPTDAFDMLCHIRGKIMLDSVEHKA